jgi:hypothetical protein
MVEIEGSPYIDMDICLSAIPKNSGVCWDATRGSSVDVFLHAVVVTGTDNVAVLAISKKKKKTSGVVQSANQSGLITGIWIAGFRAGQFSSSPPRRHSRHIARRRPSS